LLVSSGKLLTTSLLNIMCSLLKRKRNAKLGIVGGKLPKPPQADNVDGGAAASSSAWAGSAAGPSATGPLGLPPGAHTSFDSRVKGSLSRPPGSSRLLTVSADVAQRCIVVRVRWADKGIQLTERVAGFKSTYVNLGTLMMRGCQALLLLPTGEASGSSGQIDAQVTGG
jgi:hypothetical protein